MARYEIPDVVTDLAGNSVSGASVQIVNKVGGTPATIYASDTGTTTLPNPLTTGSDGRVDGWLDPGSYRANISGGSITSFSQGIEAIVGDGISRYAPGSVDVNALAATILQKLIAPGVILPFGGASAPAGYLMCQGQTVLRVDYPELFSAILTAHNTGGEAGTVFRLPNAQGRTLIGAGAGSGLTTRALGVQLGEEAHVLSIGEMPSHNHSVTDPGHAHGGQVDNDGPFAQGSNRGITFGTGTDWDNPSSGLTRNDKTNVTINANGGGASHNNMQPSLAVNYIIKT